MIGVDFCAKLKQHGRLTFGRNQALRESWKTYVLFKRGCVTTYDGLIHLGEIPSPN